MHGLNPSAKENSKYGSHIETVNGVTHIVMFKRRKKAVRISQHFVYGSDPN